MSGFQIPASAKVDTTAPSKRMSKGWNTVRPFKIEERSYKRGAKEGQPYIFLEWENQIGERQVDFLDASDDNMWRIGAIGKAAGLTWEEDLDSQSLVNLFNRKIKTVDIEVVHFGGDGSKITAYLPGGEGGSDEGDTSFNAPANATPAPVQAPPPARPAKKW